HGYRQARLTFAGSDLERVLDTHRLRTAAECGKLLTRLRLQLREPLARSHQGVIRKLPMQAGAPDGQPVCHAYTECGQHTRQGMDEDSAHARSLGDATSVLACRASETEQRKVIGIQALSGRDLPNGVRHGLDP